MDQVSLTATQFHALTAPPVNIVNAGEGITLWALGILVTLKALSNETGGSYSLLEGVVQPGIELPFHIHTLEDETWYMLEGEMLWKVGDKEFLATKGSFLHLPRLVPHTFANKSNKPAHMVITFAPGGFEKWFLDVGKEAKDLSEPPPQLTEEDVIHAITVTKDYGLIFGGAPGADHASQ